MEPVANDETNKVEPWSSLSIVVLIMLAIAFIVFVYFVCVIYNLSQFMTFMAIYVSISTIFVLKSEQKDKRPLYASIAYIISVAGFYFYVCNMGNFSSRDINEGLRFFPDTGGLMLFNFFAILSFTIFLWGMTMKPQNKISRAYIISGILILISICSLIIERINCANYHSGGFMFGNFCGVVEAMIWMFCGITAIIIAYFYTIGVSVRWKKSVIISIITLELIASVVLAANA